MIDLNETVLEKRNFFNRLIIVYVFFGLLFYIFYIKLFLFKFPVIQIMRLQL